MQLAWTLLRGLATAGARSTATGVGEVVITEGGKRIAIEAAKGMATLILAKEVSKDVKKQEKCKKCEAYALGDKYLIKRSMGDETNTQYQLKIANLSSYPLTFKAYTPYIVEGNKKPTTPIEEWQLNGVSFDGLWPLECILVEAKGRYAQFLDGSKPEFMVEKIFREMLAEAARQRAVNLRFKTTKLVWYFYENETKQHFDSIGGNIVTSIHMPL
ncbi:MULTISPECIES: Tox-REase-5 domain-containing protein [unclassified Acinetobacter]|uniref:Tox-REase-5 domain-containing protein n=1 Tax=unclassified Acinetobacter TaxID=196816 RepID=UPI0015D32531|nr:MULTISPECIES: Tox-REase-5 domain-containing protein [unclassified Acinetobacter]